MKLEFWAALLCWMMLTSGANADETFHCPKPGTVIEFTDGGKITFGDQDGLWCTGTDVRGRPWRHYAALAANGSDLHTNHVERLFPLQVGNAIAYQTNGNPSQVSGSANSVPLVTYETEVKVLRTEGLTTKAGTFETFVIEVHKYVTTRTVNGAWVTTYWYAPKVGYIVKETYETLMGYGKNSSFEATAIKFAKPGS